VIVVDAGVPAPSLGDDGDDGDLASYVALAEQLHAVLVTADSRLASAPGVGCEVDLVPRPSR
jgi:hypothetical protein